MLKVKENTVGEIVASDYRTASVFKSYGIDFCCKGNRTISEVCTKKNISESVLKGALEKVVELTPEVNSDYDRWSLDLLADYIEKKHHRYVRAKLPELIAYLEKLSKVHGKNHPELFEIRDLFAASANELLNHMEKEEKILFPAVRSMAESEMAKGQNFQTPHFGTVQMPIDMMMQEHETEGERFRQIAALTNNYTPPADGCTTYRVAFALLKEFEEDLHLHIHLENNILFPRAIELEKELSHA